MEIELDVNKTASQNAGDLFNKAKKLESKVNKSNSALSELDERIKILRTKKAAESEKKILKERKSPGKWFEKFRWFYTSSGKLAVGGRDATTNDILMKKYVDDSELVFHADIVGAPFFVIKAKPEELNKLDIEETAKAAGIFSRAWKLGYGSLAVYYAPRTQFTKSAPSGTFVGKGAFMVYGKKEWITVEIKAAIGIKEKMVTAGPPDAIKKWAEKQIVIEPGHMKQGEITKKLVRQLKCESDSIQKALPAGKTQIVNKIKK